MENRFMLSKIFIISPVQILICMLSIWSFPACAQVSEHLKNEAIVKEWQNMEKTTILFNNEAQLVPLKDLQNLSIASINIGSAYASEFDSILNKYASVKSFASSIYSQDMSGFNDLNDDLKYFNTVIVQVSDQSLNDPRVLPLLLDLQVNKHLIISFSGLVESLKILDAVRAPIIWTEKKSAGSANFNAQLIFGGVAASARLDQSISAHLSSGSGFYTNRTRLKYTVPEEVGINSIDLNAIDDIAAEAIRERATPSAVVMVVKDGKVIFNKAYGTRTYLDRTPTRINDIYDLASVTKISATTMAVMHLYDEGKLKLDTNIGAYIPRARNTNKNDIAVRQVMLHQAGFIPYIPFFRNLVESDHSRDSSALYPTKVADNYYLRKDYFKEVMWPMMLSSSLSNQGKYIYSDLSMYFMKEIVERQSGKPMADYVQDVFYKPLGMVRAGFNPRLRFPKEEIIPTEDDTFFRKTLLEGYVHDQGAAMVGGVSGHAGLFSTANDLGILYQMILNGGTYGGDRYLNTETIKMFTAKQSPVSRRGLGFDRYDEDSSRGYPSKLASSQTFGHTGYTGTCVWIDPQYNLVYVFLSNRVNPGVSSKLLSLNIRSRIQDVIYEAIQK